MGRSAQRTGVGVWIDGRSAVAVVSAGGVAESVSSADGSTAADALLQVLVSTRVSDPVRVAWVGRPVRSIVAEVTSPALSHTWLESLAEAVPGSASDWVVAARIADEDAPGRGDLTSALALAVPAGVVDDLYRAFSQAFPGRVLEVVPAGLVMSGDGLWLGVHGSCVDVALVHSGAPVRYEVLDTAGVEGFVTALGGTPQARARYDSAVAGSTSDPLAAGELARWFNQISDQARAVVDRWTVDGAPVASQHVFLHGAGSSAASLPAALARRSLMLAETPAVRSLPGLPVDQRRDKVGALFASLSVGSDLPWAVAVPSWRTQELAAAVRLRRLHRVRRRVVYCVSALVAPSVLAMAAGGAVSWQSDWQLRSRLGAAASAALAGQVLRDAVHAVEGDPVAAVTQAATGALSPGMSLRSVSADAGTWRIVVAVAGQDLSGLPKVTSAVSSAAGVRVAPVSFGRSGAECLVVLSSEAS